ncbi:Cellulose synthase catalytic subunit [UDP-forming] [compost metagenome]
MNNLGWLGCTLILGFATLLFLTGLPLDAAAQTWLAYAAFALLLLLRIFRQSKIARLLLFILAGFITFRYFFWRSTETLGWHGPLSFAAAIALYTAEVYGMIIFLTGLFSNVNPIDRRPKPPVGVPESYPTVDVLIPSYNEGLDLLETTLIAATQLDYPADRVTVWLCDDGGTDALRTHPDPERARAAQERQTALMALCEQLGARYLTRARNEGAKAGNLNEALKRIHGELVLVLDADHVPAADFLQETVGFMQGDPRLFLVQTPHFFINPDPLEKNHDLFGRIPSENEMFYQVTQPGLDFWNSAFFCGSAALLRRSALEEAGGLSGVTITEDAETAMTLHAKGYRSAYLNRPLISGLQPETYSSFVVQRVRWAQGMIQIFLLKNPLFFPGLAWYQRLNYFSTSFYWLFGYPRMVFLLAPTAFLIFGLKIYDANLQTYLAYAIPYVATSLVLSDYLYGKVRWTFVSEVYELLQAFYTFPGILRVLRNPRSPGFAVTPKGETADRDAFSELARPLFLVYALTWFTLAFGAARWFLVPEERTISGITMAWEVFNLLLLNAAAGVLYERRQRRSNPRMPADLPAELTLGERQLAGRITNLSVGGAYVTADLTSTEGLAPGAPLTLHVADPAANGLERHLKGRVMSATRLKAGGLGLGIQFCPATLDEKRAIVSLAHGDSQRWLEFQQSRHRHPGIIRSFGFLLQLGIHSTSSRLDALFRRLIPRPGPAVEAPPPAPASPRS